MVIVSPASPGCDEARIFDSPVLSDIWLLRLLATKAVDREIPLHVNWSFCVLISGPIFLPLRSRPIALRQQWICKGTPSTHTHLSGHPGCYLFQETLCDSSSLMASLLPQGEPQKHLVYLTYFLMFVLFWHGVHYRYSFIWGNSTSLTVKSLKAQIVYSTVNPILCPAVLNVCFLSSLEGKMRVFL